MEPRQEGFEVRGSNDKKRNAHGAERDTITYHYYITTYHNIVCSVFQTFPNGELKPVWLACFGPPKVAS